jgi:hypothetical protein
MADWSTGFEQVPGGGNFGSISAIAMRDIKTKSKMRYEAEHTFDETDNPNAVHIAGKATIVKMAGETPTTFLKVGGLQYDHEAQVLYRDTGAAMEAASTRDHGALSNLTDVTCHDHYLLKDGSNDILNVSIPEGKKLKGLAEGAGGYSGEEVLPRALHMVNADGADHDDNIITDITGVVSIGKDKLKVTAYTVHNGDIGGLGELEVTIGARAFLPYVGGNIENYFYMHPAFAAPGDWPANYVAKVTFRNPNLFARRLHLLVKRLD